MQEPSSENISQHDSNPSIARLSLQQSHKILIQNRLEFSKEILTMSFLSADLTERIASPNKFEGLVPGQDGLLELGVFEGGQNLLKFWPWCIA
jgi:hypothetical protein